MEIGDIEKMSNLGVIPQPWQLGTGDCRELLPALPDAFCQLVFTDPPFNNGTKYPGHGDKRPSAEYLADLEFVFRQCQRVLSPSGSIRVAISQEYQARVQLLLESVGFHWRNTIAWTFTFGQSQRRRFTRGHTPLLHYVCDPKRFTFNADAVRVKSWRRLNGDKRANPPGKAPDDVWKLPRIPGNARNRLNYPCQMLVKIPARAIRATSNPGDLVLNPFVGTGSTLVAAMKQGRRCYGIEKRAPIVEQALRRLRKDRPDLQAW
jgi:site-specific DNA-methyltransferase (adenine-specific)